ncbi:MAG TPA: nucleotidyltransferase domain-containing protein [Conexibacter sp.]
MDVARPYTALSSSLDSTVLAVLARTTYPLTGRDVARLAGRSSHSGVLDVLNRLTEHGLVDRREAGRAWLYTLNREHLAAPAVEVLADMRTTLLERVRGAIEAWKLEPIHVSLFGSAARGDGDTQSDIDLFLVRPTEVDEDDQTWVDQRDGLATSVQRWTGNRAGIAEVSEEELNRLREEAPPIVAALRDDAITLHGRPIAELLSNAVS